MVPNHQTAKFPPEEEKTLHEPHDTYQDSPDIPKPVKSMPMANMARQISIPDGKGMPRVDSKKSAMSTQS